MNVTSLPPLNALKAFAAFAQTGTTSGAGALLNVTHAAVSQQLKLLEAHLGVTLLERAGRTLTLTAEGRVLADTLRQSFSAIEQTVAALTKVEHDRPLQVSMTPMFASGWMMPRLGEFRQRHPEVDLMLNPTPHLVELSPGGVDVAIRYGAGHWPGLEAALLIQSSVAIVAAPSLVSGRDLSTPADLLEFPWLQELGTTEAKDWLESHGVTEAVISGLVQMPGNLVIEAARAGQGIAVTTRALVEPDLESGQLVVLFEDDSKTGYFTVTRPGLARPPLKKFLRWIHRQSEN